MLGLWKYASIGAGALCLVLSVQTVILKARVSGLKGDLAACNFNLETARENERALEAALREQGDAIKAVGAESARRLAAAEVALVVAKQNSREATMRAGVILSPVAGPTLEQRVLAVDAKVLEGLK
jgi:hypothetical protein